MNRFDNLLLAAERGGSPKPWRDALALVADTALVCRAWLEEEQPDFTPADLLAMTKMVIDQENVEWERQRMDGGR